MAKEANNRRTSDVHAVKSRNVKTSRNDGTLDIVGPLAPQGNKRLAKDFASSPNTVKRVRADGLDDDLINRKDSAYTGPRARVHGTPGVNAERTGDNIEQVAQGDIPGDLDIP
jgi:hypothetical protein